MAKVDYAASAAQIVELVGGAGNISKVTHCITRVRFALKDPSITHDNTEAVSAVPGVIQVVEAGGQYQVVIGTTVAQMYDEVVAITGNAGGEVSANAEDAPQEQLSLPDRFIKMISGIMVPILGSLTACGIVASLSMVLVILGVSTESDTFTFFYGLGQTCVFFFPVLVGVSTAKYFGMDSYLGGVIGAAMCYPVINNPELAGTTGSLFGVLPIPYMAYTSSVFPALAAVAFASLLYKFFKKHVPAVLSFFMVPTLTLLVTVPLSLAIIGPVVSFLSGIVSSGIMTLYSLSPILTGIVINAIWLPVVVPLGLHQALALVLISDLITTGSSSLLGLLCGITSATGVLMAVWAKTKDANTKQLAASTALTNLFGISEPGLYGVIMQHKETMLALGPGGAICGIIPALFGTTVYSLGASGILGLPMYLSPDGSMTSFIGAVVTQLSAMVVCFLITYFWSGFDPDKK